MKLRMKPCKFKERYFIKILQYRESYDCFRILFHTNIWLAAELQYAIYGDLPRKLISASLNSYRHLVFEVYFFFVIFSSALFPCRPVLNL